MDVQQSNIAYITGTSKGIGRALAEKLLAENFLVFGISRKNCIQHPNFTFIELDLSKLDAIESFDFPEYVGNVLLVNNAGIIGEIAPVGKQKSEDIIKVINTNVIAPQLLTNKFLNKYLGSQGEFHILNISSGAGKSAIDGWASYCSSKAAVDIYAETVKTELEIRNLKNWHVHSVAPGVVDTDMQVQIRSASVENFTPVQKFKDFKEKGDLFTAEYVADKLFEVIQNPTDFKENLQSIRDY